MSNEYEAALAEEITLENLVSDCNQCSGTGIITVRDEFGEHPEECVCLKKYHENF